MRSSSHPKTGKSRLIILLLLVLVLSLFSVAASGREEGESFFSNLFESFKDFLNSFGIGGFASFRVPCIQSDSDVSWLYKAEVLSGNITTIQFEITNNNPSALTEIFFSLTPGVIPKFPEDIYISPSGHVYDVRITTDPYGIQFTDQGLGINSGSTDTLSFSLTKEQADAISSMEAFASFGNKHSDVTFSLESCGTSLKDSDKDGLADYDEVNTYGTDPENTDTDDDGLTDGEEVLIHLSDPLNPDTDSDGLTDGFEVDICETAMLDADCDEDGLNDGDEVNTYGSDPKAKDTDGDGLLDGDEVFLYLSDPTLLDTDGDGLHDNDEVLNHNTNPADTDSDNDGIPDPEELVPGSDGYITDPNSADTDGDGLEDWDEIHVYLTEPVDPDMDGDGLSDKEELETFNSDPKDPDTDDDGIPDGEEVGREEVSVPEKDAPGERMMQGRMVCQENSDCPSGQICLFGFCVPNFMCVDDDGDGYYVPRDFWGDGGGDDDEGADDEEDDDEEDDDGGCGSDDPDACEIFCKDGNYDRNIEVSDGDVYIDNCDINGNVEVIRGDLTIIEGNPNGNVEVKDGSFTFRRANANGNIEIEDSDLKLDDVVASGNVEFRSGSSSEDVEIAESQINGNLEIDGGSLVMTDNFISGNLEVTCDTVVLEESGNNVNGNEDVCSESADDNEDDETDEDDDEGADDEEDDDEDDDEDAEDEGDDCRDRECDHNGRCGQGKMLICHYPPGKPQNRHTICISESAWPAHQARGDTLGKCLEELCGPLDCDDSDPLVHPEAEEFCNGYDDDCDGDIDEGCEPECISRIIIPTTALSDAGNDILPEVSASDNDRAKETLGTAVKYMYFDWESIPSPGMALNNTILGIEHKSKKVDVTLEYLGADWTHICNLPESRRDILAFCDLTPYQSDDLSTRIRIERNGMGRASEWVDHVFLNMTECEAPECTDSDGDGYAIEGGLCGAVDCDDNASGIHPGAFEQCNFLDDNCNGLVDEGYDQDDDGFTTCGGDCDDTNYSINPNATELCNGVDDDCDGQVDEVCAELPVKPILECVSPNNNGSFTAFFGYLNENNASVSIPISASYPHNKFTGGGSPDIDRGQPSVFQPGRTPYYPAADFSVVFDGSDLVWTLTGPDGSTRTSTASSGSQLCPTDCTDGDGDGFFQEGGVCGPVDCDDDNSSIYPIAPELCNFVDDNCNGLIDEGSILEDFNDGDASDGLPLTWDPNVSTPHRDLNGTIGYWQASNQSYYASDVSAEFVSLTDYTMQDGMLSVKITFLGGRKEAQFVFRADEGSGDYDINDYYFIGLGPYGSKVGAGYFYYNSSSSTQQHGNLSLKGSWDELDYGREYVLQVSLVNKSFDIYLDGVHELSYNDDRFGDILSAPGLVGLRTWAGDVKFDDFEILDQDSDLSVCLNCTDLDGDGFNQSAPGCGPADCNDSDPDVYPGALEICNSLDDDCDGQVDEDCVVRSLITVQAAGTGAETHLVLKQDDAVFYDETKIAHVFTVDPGTYDLYFTRPGGLLEQIDMIGVNISMSENLTLRIGEGLDTSKVDFGGIDNIYAIDPTDFDFDWMTVSINPQTGEVLFKCAAWNFSSQECMETCFEDDNETACGKNWTFLKYTGGEPYTLNLTGLDPGFAETNETIDVSLAPVDDETFVIAYVDKTEWDVSFKVMHANGSVMTSTVDVDNDVDITSRVDVAMINDTHFAIAWVDGPSNDVTKAIYDIDGNQASAPSDVDTFVRTDSDVSVAQLGNRFAVCYANDADNDADFKIYNNDGSQAVGERRVDWNMNPDRILQNYVSCSAFSDSSWVYFWFDDAGNDATYRFVDGSGNTLTGQIDVDNNVGGSGQVAASVLDDDRFAMVWWDSSNYNIYTSIRDVNGSLILSPTTVDSFTGLSSRVAIAPVRLNHTVDSDSYVLAWYDNIISGIRAAVYDGSGTQITSPFTVDSDPSFNYRLIDVVGRDPRTNNSLCPGTFVVAYANRSNIGFFKTFYVNGTEWDGDCSIVACIDNDGDGYNQSAPGCGPTDCDDSNSSIYPGAAELCNFVDDDCDTLIDEGFDTDGDNFTTCAGDCNDNNASINPNATELCNFVDDNCNSLIDEGFDLDGDGFTTCGGDCNDNNFSINPNASELCNNVDDDCDTIIDQIDRSCGSGNCSGNETCVAGTWSSCSSFGIDCGICASCNQSGICSYNSTQQSDCDYNDLATIATCTNDPDLNPFTWDYAPGFDSYCTAIYSCAEGSYNYTHTCNISTCGAQCAQDSDCNSTECDQLDGCYSGTYRDYFDQANTCYGNCTCTDNSCTFYNTTITDVDGDGYDTECDNDCNDNNASINPGATELCNFVDDNCNNLTDEGFDLDNDGFTTCGGDCNDNNASINPNATELCNFVDDNCNSLIDEGFDLDSDGFTTCGGDCNDNNASINPNASELCNNVDDNCDSIIDYNNQSCGSGNCSGIQTCIAGVWQSCDSFGDDCGVCASCNSTGFCSYNSTQQSDCDFNDLSTIATCTNDPDLNPYTWDYALGFDSYCTAIYSCAAGTYNYTHTCSIANCSAECESDSDCNATECDQLDGCYSGTYRDYFDQANTCYGNCTCTDNSCTFYNTTITDTDGDGYDVECDNDCDDNNASINPGATELCNFVDDNCNNLTDEGFDLDNDGFTTCGGDCNDNNASINPNATELCNFVDDNCNSLIDEGFDLDSDGFTTCGGDCNDNNASINPNASELCNNVDDDCDTFIDQIDRSCGSGNCSGNETCVAGTWSSCSSFGIDCGVCASCNSTGFCSYNSTQQSDCDFNDLSTIATCTNDPDLNPYTWDYAEGFDSYCTAIFSCAVGTYNYTHTCNISTCGAQCEQDSDCNSTECDQLDGCYSGTFRDYVDVNNSCLGNCSCTNNSCTSYTTIVTDVDGDGFDTECDGDCNDANSSIYPNASELCNFVDDDCDSLIDEGFDLDNDGFTTCGGDCNDNNSSINPNATEVCNNGIDDDCDGQIDLADPDCSAYCVDVDGDGFNVTGGPCGPVDCNDSNFSIYPGATEFCNFVDDDCDGQVDEGFDTDSDGFTACGGDCNDSNSNINPNATEICNNMDDDCDSLIDEDFVNDTCQYICTGYNFTWTNNGGSLNCCGDDSNEDSPYETVETSCFDGQDNDCDGAIDTADADCSPYLCIDNDGDGFNVTVNGSCGPADCNDANSSIYPGATELCNLVDDNCNGQIDEGFDLDNDGFTTCAGDCADNNASINPNATEICNFVDDDCDSLVDEGFDNDSDGYTTCGGDCNDANASINPNASELCNFVDDDCDTLIDEGFDLDNDGFTTCGGDCNDTNSSINPNATEVCNNGIDDDCDSLIDLNDPDCSGFCTDGDGDGYNTTGGLCGPVDCDDSNFSIYPGAPELCNFVDDDCDSLIDEGFDQDNDSFTTCGGDCDDSNPNINPNASEICNNVDDDCDAIIDQINRSCGLGNCSGVEQCFAGVWSDCSSYGFDCGICASCNSTGICSYNSTQQSDCDFNDLSTVATCTNDPDLNPFTWDYAPSFDSQCLGINNCSVGSYDYTHTCSITNCSAECESDSDCNSTECDQLDGCYSGTFRDYVDVNNSCLGNCSCANNSCTSYTNVVTDTDGDGYDVECDNDCDDGNASINPGATELCNFVDDNCNNLTDEGFDTDGDGYTTCAGDCDDSNSSINPGAPELCNFVDDDCDSLIDEGFDQDNDSFTTCGGDCDDSNPNINPNASEICNNLDDDCDSVIDQINRSCGSGNCSGNQSCIAGVWSNCSSQYTDCGICAACNNNGLCSADLTQDSDCDYNDLPTIATCTNNPDLNPFTWDYAPGFDSYCTGLYSCAAGTYNYTHTCSIANCSAECEQDSDCNFTACDNNDGCYNGTYYDYFDVSNFCLDNCSCSDHSCSNFTTVVTDVDGDGFDIECDGDCNDSNSSIYPGATELCNFVDDNCNNLTDEGFDTDGDGYTTCAGDCDDSNSSIYPGAPEFCNFVDDDCDGFIDEGFDSDGDGFTVCNGDCDDSNASINPNATELCNNIDDDCDSIIDYNNRSCGTGNCTGIQTCIAGLWGNCSSYGSDCGICAACNNNGLCSADLTQDSDCDYNDLPTIATCTNDPDLNPFTWDYAGGFDSFCLGIGSCAVGNYSYTHTCNISTCGAECEQDSDCPDSECDHLDGCYSGTFRDYFDQANTCNDNCSCTENTCAGSYSINITDVDGDGFDIECDGDCNDNNSSINPNTTEICNFVDDNCNNLIDEGFDQDSDGFTTCNGDCNDSNPNINPNATEVCNFVDDNCNGQIDEGFDFDNDGFTTCGGDCDDNNASINPNAAELCNFIDDNCNGQIDEGFDKDNDTYTTCGGDCDDNNSSINPNATEVCNFVDDNCNNLTDEGFDQDSDGFTTCAGDCNDNNASINPNATELCNLVDDDCDTLIDEGFTNDTCIYTCQSSGFNWTGNGGSLSCCGDDSNEDNPFQTPNELNCYDGNDNDCDGFIDLNDPDCSPYLCVDHDGDGYNVTVNGSCGPTDCNDNNASIYPGATELCNLVDDNCNGQIDEGFDQDNDGFTVCGGDCDDNNASINPNATEVCNFVDDDCDSLIDEDFDTDADGFTTCGGDCNDNNSSINPNATELCNTVDDDCDSVIDNITKACGTGSCIGNQVCTFGSWGSCSSSGTDCGVCAACNDNGVCSEDLTQDSDCDAYDLSTVATCTNNPDLNPYTWDYAPGFDSQCLGINNCSVGSYSYTHTCNISTCGAECEQDSDCTPTDCDALDGCYNGTFYDYLDVTNDCLGNCSCTSYSCIGSYTMNITDNDGDSYDIECDGDCDDNNSSINPGAAELCNFVDDNCNGLIDEGFDNDFDGFTTCAGDCNDSDASINPNATEICSNGVDDNCDGQIDLADPDCSAYCIDNDGDGFNITGGPCGPIDCNDNESSIFPGATELCNFVDDNCNNLTDEGFDQDNDTYTTCAGDCDDSNSSINPGAAEVCNFADDNCDGVIDEGFDQDNDTYTTCAGDCNDNNSSIYPGAPELCNDVDDDCDTFVDEGFTPDTCIYTCTALGYSWTGNGGNLSCCGDDSNEDNPFQTPNELNCYDGNDNDCDGFIDLNDPDCSPYLCVDQDGDGYNVTVNGSCGPTDCNDYNSSIYPGAAELCNFVDDDCNGQIDEGFDQDNDTFTTCAGDCDDTNSSINPNATEICNFVDDNCDGQIDEGFDLDNDTFTTCAGDCNDNNSSINPNATELCNGVDDNCDSLTDEGFSNETCSFVCSAFGFNWTGNGGNLNCCGNNPLEDSPFETPSETSCSDSHDNDCDGLIDYADSDCPDDLPPTIIIVSPLNNTGFNQTQIIDVRANVTDNINVTQVNASISIPDDGTVILPLVYDPGSGLWENNFSTTYNITVYNLTVSAVDDSNNSASEDGYFNVLDVTPPSISDISPDTGIFALDSSILVSANVSDPFQDNTHSVWAVITLPDSTSLTLPLAFNASVGRYVSEFINSSQTGVYNITFYANDTSGNLASYQTDFTVTIFPEVEILEPSDNDLFFENTSINFTGNASDPDGSIVSYNWTSSLDGFLNNSTGFNISDLSVGSHTINFTVIDDLGASASDYIIVNIAADTDPHVTIISPPDNSTHIAGNLIIFRGSAYDNGTITDILWTSSISGNLSTNLTFNQTLTAGTHVLTLYATDDQNNTAWDSVTIVVTSAASPPGGGGGGGAADEEEPEELEIEEPVPVPEPLELNLTPPRCIADGVCDADCVPPDPDCELKEELDVEIVSAPSSFDIFGRSADIRVSVENTGDVALGGVNLDIDPDALFDSSSVSIGYLAPGASRTVSVPLDADICRRGGGNIPQTIGIEAEASSGKASYSDSVSMDLTAPDFIVKPKKRGDDLEICIAYNNLGEDRRTQLEVEFELHKDRSTGEIDFFSRLNADADSVLVVTDEYDISDLPSGNYDVKAKLYEKGRVFGEDYVVEEDSVGITL